MFYLQQQGAAAASPPSPPPPSVLLQFVKRTESAVRFDCCRAVSACRLKVYCLQHLTMQCTVITCRNQKLDIAQLTWLCVSAELDEARDAKAQLIENKAAWEAAKAQQEAALQEAREGLAKAASEADKKAVGSEKAALALEQTKVAEGDLARLMS